MFDMLAGIVIAWSVVDGDTIGVQAQVWPNIVVTERVRLLEVDTPEIHASSTCERDLALKAKDFTFKALGSGRKVEVHIRPGKDERDAFGRILGYVYIDGVSLGDSLLANRLARKYGIKTPWC